MSVISDCIGPVISDCIGSVFGGSKYGTDLAMEFDVSSKSLTLPAGNLGVYDANIDWGNGDTDVITAYNDAKLTKTYAAEDPDIVVVRISGSFPAFRSTSSADIQAQFRRILSMGDVGWLSLNSLMWGTAVTEVNSGVTDTSGVINGYGMCRNNANLVSINLSTINTSSITNLSSALVYNVGVHDYGIDSWAIGACINFGSFMEGSQMPIAAYDRTLASWGNQTLAAGASTTTIHFGSSQYLDQDSKNLLLAQVAGIIDGGQANGEYHGSFLTNTGPFTFVRNSVQTAEDYEG